MARPVALGAAGGSLTTFLLSLVRDSFDRYHWPIRVPPLPADCVCPSIPTLIDQIDNIGLCLFLVGLVIGLFFGFLLDLLWVAKERWRRLIFGDLSRVGSTGRALHKVLE